MKVILQTLLNNNIELKFLEKYHKIENFTRIGVRSALQLEVRLVDHVDVDMTGLPVGLAYVSVTLDID